LLIRFQEHPETWPEAIATLNREGVKPTKIEYPKPIRFTAEFAPDGLDA